MHRGRRQILSRGVAQILSGRHDQHIGLKLILKAELFRLATSLRKSILFGFELEAYPLLGEGCLDLPPLLLPVKFDVLPHQIPPKDLLNEGGLLIVVLSD